MARQAGRPPLRLVYVGDAMLARECFGRAGGSIEVVGEAPEPGRTIDSLPAAIRTGVPRPLDFLFIEHGYPGVDTLAILKDIADRQLHVPTVIVADWDEDLAVLALTLGAGDYVIKSRASFRAVYFRLKRLIAHSTALDEQSSMRDAHAATLERQRATREDLGRRLADAQAGWRDAEQRLSESRAAIKRSHQDRLADAVSAARELAQCESGFAAKFAEARAASETLEYQLASSQAALRHSQQQDAAAAHKLVEREAAAALDRATAAATRKEFEQRLSEAVGRLAAVEAAFQDATERHRSEIDDAATRLTVSQHQSAARLEDAAAATRALERELAASAAALAGLERQLAGERQAALEDASRLQTNFDAQLAQEDARRAALEKQLRESSAALQRAGERHASEMADAEARLAQTRELSEARLAEAAVQLMDHQEHAAASLAQSAALAAGLQRQLDDAAVALEAEQRRAADLQDAGEHASQKLAELNAQLVAERAGRAALEEQLRTTETALHFAGEQHASEMAHADARLIDSRNVSEARLTEALSVAGRLQRALTDSAATVERVELQAAFERQAATEERAHLQATFEAELAREMTGRQALARLLDETGIAQREAEAQHAVAIETAAAARAEAYTKAQEELAQVAVQAEQQMAAERKAAADHDARREEEFEAALTQEIARRQSIEQELAGTRDASEQAHRQFVAETAAMRLRAGEHEARLEERAAAANRQIQQLEGALAEERENSARARTASEADAKRQQAEYAALQLSLDQARTAAGDTLERMSNDRAIERERLEAMVGERESELRALAAGHQTAEEEATAKLVGVEQRLEQALATHLSDTRIVAQLRDRLNEAGEELEATRRQREVLEVAADKVPQIQRQLDGLRAQHRRQFRESPVPTCRCSRDGIPTEVNLAMARLLGYARSEDMQKLDFAGAVFESGGELHWVVERCLASRSTESIETTWRRRDGRRKIVRLLAVPMADNSIELVAEDITRVRALEEKLRHSQRMEAVARFGSEVAVTCHTLLRHVKQEGQQWVSQMDSDTARYRGELLLDEVTRAAGFLGQLAAYGNEQKNVPELVDVNSVLRELEPVLKRVAGHHIELVLPAASGSLNVDVEAARIERMLVNVAAYGRERMPLGGRLIFEVACVVVDREFVAKYPNVRPGSHVLLTVHEVRDAAGANMSPEPRTPSSDNPGVDLGALQTLVSGCGGHLWMMAEPPGNMVLKIHLPRRVLDRSDPRPVSVPAARSRWIHRAFGARH